MTCYSYSAIVTCGHSNYPKLRAQEKSHPTGGGAGKEGGVRKRSVYRPWEKPSRHRGTPCTAFPWGGPSSGRKRSRGTPGGSGTPPWATAKCPPPPSPAGRAASSLLAPLNAQNSNWMEARRQRWEQGARNQCLLLSSRPGESNQGRQKPILPAVADGQWNRPVPSATGIAKDASFRSALMVGAIIGQCEGRVAMFEASAGQQDEEDEGNTTSSLVHIGGGAKRNGIQSNHGIGGGASQCVASRPSRAHGRVW